jgi:Protein of unknown function (DUF742)
MNSQDDRQPADRRSLGPVVRPYAITGGRVTPDHADDLELEALVSTTALGEVAPGLSYEWRAIARLCRDLQSIAEIGALLDMPLGVTRVLVADMAAEGLLRIHRPEPRGQRAGLWVLERVLQGLRRL